MDSRHRFRAIHFAKTISCSEFPGNPFRRHFGLWDVLGNRVKRDLLADGLSGVWAMWCQDGFASIARMGRQGLWFPVWRVVGNANGRLDVWACGRRSLGRVVARAFGVVNAMFTRWSFHGGVWRGARGKGPLIQFAFRILDFPVSQLIFPPHYPTPLVYTLAWSSRNAFWVARV